MPVKRLAWCLAEGRSHHPSWWRRCSSAGQWTLLNAPSSPSLGVCVLDSSFAHYPPEQGLGEAVDHHDRLEFNGPFHRHERAKPPMRGGQAEGGWPETYRPPPPLASQPDLPAQASLSPGQLCPRLCSESPSPLFLPNKAPSPRLPPNRHLGPPGLGIKACFAKEALCLEKHPSPAAQPFKEPALFCAEKAPPDARAGRG